LSLSRVVDQQSGALHTALGKGLGKELLQRRLELLLAARFIRRVMATWTGCEFELAAISEKKVMVVEK